MSPEKLHRRHTRGEEKKLLCDPSGIGAMADQLYKCEVGKVKNRGGGVN